MSVTIRYQTITRKDLVTRERTFPTQAAMERWVRTQERLAEAERGGFVGVTAYSFDGVTLPVVDIPEVTE